MSTETPTLKTEEVYPIRACDVADCGIWTDRIHRLGDRFVNLCGLHRSQKHVDAVLKAQDAAKAEEPAKPQNEETAKAAAEIPATNATPAPK